MDRPRIRVLSFPLTSSHTQSVVHQGYIVFRCALTSELLSLGFAILWTLDSHASEAQV